MEQSMIPFRSLQPCVTAFLNNLPAIPFPLVFLSLVYVQPR